MQSKRRYKICICWFIFGELQSFRNCKGFSIIFPTILDTIHRIKKENFFLFLSPPHFLNPKILGFIFPTKNRLALGYEIWKIKLQKIVGNLLEKLRKLYMNRKVI